MVKYLKISILVANVEVKQKLPLNLKRKWNNVLKIKYLKEVLSLF